MQGRHVFQLLPSFKYVHSHGCIELFCWGGGGGGGSSRFVHNFIICGLQGTDLYGKGARVVL